MSIITLPSSSFRHHKELQAYNSSSPTKANKVLTDTHQAPNKLQCQYKTSDWSKGSGFIQKTNPKPATAISQQ
jgi:hypothetical protein